MTTRTTEPGPYWLFVATLIAAIFAVNILGALVAYYSDWHPSTVETYLWAGIYAVTLGALGRDRGWWR